VYQPVHASACGKFPGPADFYAKGSQWRSEGAEKVNPDYRTFGATIRDSMKFKPAIFTLLLLLTMLACLGQDQDQDHNKSPNSAYGALLARAQAGDLSIDFQKLRFSWMESPERHAAKDTTDQEHAMFAALKAKDFKKAVANADVVLANEFVNMDAHFVEYLSYRELHEDQKSEFHKAVFSGLLKSITSSGDGKSRKTAYIVISTNEEYVVLQVMGLKPGTQSLVHDGRHSYDLMKVTDDSNQPVELYFNVDIPFKHYLGG
jgi:Domain of unknown function (DUF4919)